MWFRTSIYLDARLFITVFYRLSKYPVLCIDVHVFFFTFRKHKQNTNDILIHLILLCVRWLRVFVFVFSSHLHYDYVFIFDVGRLYFVYSSIQYTETASFEIGITYILRACRTRVCSIPYTYILLKLAFGFYLHCTPVHFAVRPLDSLGPEISFHRFATQLILSSAIFKTMLLFLLHWEIKFSSLSRWNGWRNRFWIVLRLHTKYTVTHIHASKRLGHTYPHTHTHVFQKWRPIQNGNANNMRERFSNFSLSPQWKSAYCEKGNRTEIFK